MTENRDCRAILWIVRNDIVGGVGMEKPSTLFAFGETVAATQRDIAQGMVKIEIAASLRSSQ